MLIGKLWYTLAMKANCPRCGSPLVEGDKHIYGCGSWYDEWFHQSVCCRKWEKFIK